jgi:16S rRNA (uracil1498-N3)-methyltransferase
MTRRRWIADEHDADRAALVGEHAAHLARVLRARVGQEFDIVSGQKLRRGRVTLVTEDRVEFALGEELQQPAELDVTVLLAVFKFDRFEWAIEKLTELGARRIVPLIAARTDVHLAQAAGKRVERWQRITREAAEQSRRLSVPEVVAPQGLQDVIQREGCRLRLAESDAEESLTRALQDHNASENVSIAIGPEGGWTEDEQAQFAAAGWKAVSLGTTILRAETAAIAALAVIQSRFA